jgi:hypothetical protein
MDLHGLLQGQLYLYLIAQNVMNVKEDASYPFHLSLIMSTVESLGIFIMHNNFNSKLNLCLLHLPLTYGVKLNDIIDSKTL